MMITSSSRLKKWMKEPHSIEETLKVLGAAVLDLCERVEELEEKVEDGERSETGTIRLLE